MKLEFTKGNYHFHKEPNFNYQMNRWLAFGNLPFEEVQSAANKIKTLEDWKREFVALAKKAHESGIVKHEAAYYRAVDFFLPYSDQDKSFIYDTLVRLFRESFKEFFSNGRIIEKRVPFDGIDMPIYFAPHKKDEPLKGTVVLTGGFDCYKEELIPILIYFADNGYDFYYFEGPGQGEVLHKYNYPMTHEWEKPIKAVLDTLGLEDITLIGLSLGGYLAPRAAVFEPRIKSVIAWGALYDFYKVTSTRRGPGLALFIHTMMTLRLAWLFNLIVKQKMKRDAYTYWGIDHGMHVMGKTSPYSYFKKIKLFTTRKISREITQDFLLLAGSHDHFCDIDLFHKQAKMLTSVRSFTGRIFTKAESADNHCQFGNLELVLKEMVNWIENISKEV